MIDRLAEIGRRLWYLANRSRLDRELREEMAAHRAMKGAGGPRFGNELRLREEAADAWGWTWLDRLAQDVRFGARLLRRSPAFTLTAVLVLSLGIGVNLAAFQVFDAVALSWLPVRAPERLVNLSSRTATSHSTSFSYPEFAFYRDRATTLSASFGLTYGAVEVNGMPAVAGEFVSASYFADMGVRPLAGRLFDRSDERAGAEPVVLLGETFWRTAFGSDASIPGHVVRVNGRPFTIVGVVPSSFVAFHHDATAVWIPIVQHEGAFTGSTLLSDWSAKGGVRFYARLREGASVAAAQAELAGLAAALHRARPTDTPEGEWLEVRPAGTYLALDEGNAAAMVFVCALVLLVLITACMNLGVLVLARTLVRDREFSVRLSVGASRGRILRQLLTEHLMLGALGAAVGCAVAAAGTRAFAVATAQPPGLAPHLSWRSGGVAIGLAMVSSVAFGFTPALQAIRPQVARRLRFRAVLVAVQVAAAAVLLIVSGLFVRGVTRVTRVSLGFDYQHSLLADPDLAAHGLQPPAAKAYWQRVDARLRELPGVADLALTSLPPFGNRVSIDRQGTVFYHVTPSYFSTLRIPLLRGRLFRDGETGVTIVSESLARRRWPGVDALGQRFQDALIIGVAADARTVRVGEPAATECYFAMSQSGLAQAVMILRTTGSPRDAARTTVSIVKAEGPGLTPFVEVLGDALDDRLDGPRRVALIASSLGVTALLLAVIGLGGLFAYTVSQRTREIGVCLALGARPVHVFSAVARQYRVPLIGGAAAGSALAAAAGTVLSRELFGISQFDPLAHGGALLLFAAAAACAAAPSLLRAVRVDPVRTLRAE